MNITRFNSIFMLLCLFFAAQRASAQCDFTLSADVTNVSCFGGNNGAIDLVVNGGTQPIQYEWSNGVQDEDVADLSAGTYTVTVTNGLGCTKTFTQTVSAPAQLSVSITGRNIDCEAIEYTFGVIDLTAVVQGGSSPYLYLWSNNVQGGIISTNLPGTYSVTIIDGQSCVATAVRTLIADTIPPVSDAGIDKSLSCQLSQVTIGGNGTASGPGITIFWTGPGITGNNSNPFQTVSVPGTYTLKVGNASNMCGSQDIVVVSGQGPPIADAGPDTGIPCGGGQVTLDGSGSSSGAAYTYVWTTTNGNFVSGINTSNPVVDESGTYKLSVFDIQNACIMEDVVIVFPGPIIPVQDRYVLDVSCTGQGQLGEAGVNVIQGTSPNTYLWSNGSTNSSVINVLAGTFTVTVTDATGCNYFGVLVVGEDHSNVSLTTVVTNKDCAGGIDGAIDLSVTGISSPISYAWGLGETTQDITGLVQGTYFVTVSFAFGECSITTSAYVDQINSTIQLATLATEDDCTGNCTGLIDLTVTGGTSPYQYIWGMGNSTQDVTNLCPGNYTVTVTDATGCTKTASGNVGQTPGFTLSAVVSASTACAFSNGAIDLTVTPPGSYTYSWSNGATSQDPTGLSPGTYAVTVSDGGTCTAVDTYNVPDNPNNPIASAIFVPSTCDFNNGSIDASVTGGVAPYTTLWSNGTTTEDLSNIPAGFYELTVTGANGCTNTVSVDVTNNNLSISINGTITPNADCAGNPNGSIDVAVTPLGSYTYTWSNGATVEDINGLQAGNYDLTVSAGGSCTQTASFAVSNNSNVPSIVLNVTDASCNGNDGAIDLTVIGGTPTYIYAWSNGSMTEDLAGIPAGNYMVTVTDAVGCTQTASATVGQPIAILVTETHINVLCNGGSNGSIDLTVTGGTPGFTYTWSNGMTTQDIGGLQAGTYTVTVTDAFGCTRTGSTTVTQPTDLVLSTVITHVSCFGGNNGAVNLTPSGGSSAYTYLWSNTATTQDLSNLTVGIYTVTVTDANNCIEISTMAVAQPTQIIFSIVSLSNDCSTETITGPNLPNFSYQWSGPNGFTATTAAINANFSGLYTLTITNLNGCTATNDYAVSLSGGGACGAITGRVFHDEDESCSLDFGEPGLTGWIVRAEGANDTLYGITNALGQYLVGVPVGTYSMKVFVPNGLWSVCPGGILATVGAAGDTVSGGDFPVKSSYLCPALTVSIGTNQLRRCFGNNSYAVEYCNQGTQKAEDAYITVVLDPFLTLLSSSVAYTDLGSNALHFEVGDLDIGECGMFSLQVFVNCNAALGQTHCTQAAIYPDTLCVPTSANWSGASLNVQSVCNNDSLRFIIQNEGKATMSTTQDYIVVEDGIMFRSGVLPPLVENASMEIALPANGSTWRVEVGQEQFHPYPAPIGLSVEGCTSNASFSTGFVNQFPTPDESPAVDIDCTVNIGSFDPNDKHGYPVGYGADHYVRPGTDIEYLIRFQNTGTDTAFTVQIVDTLSSWLDPATIRFGASSHAYRYDLNGEGIVHFIFENILLPDSNTNEVASNGFAKFIIKPRLDAPLETLIENTAAIYFDFNDPVFTNTTFHRLGNNFITVGLWQPVVPEARVIAMPNPFSEQTILEVSGLARTTGLRLQVFDLRGNVVREMESDNEFFQLRKGDCPSGIYLFKITQNGRLVGNGKLVGSRGNSR